MAYPIFLGYQSKYLKACWDTTQINQYKDTRLKKVSGQLVLLSFDVTAFTPAAYQRSSLLRPLKEISS